jgi:hypothetical protein
MGVPSAAAAQNRWDFFRVLALSGCCFSLFSVLFLAITVPMLYHRLEEERALIEAKSIQFKVDYFFSYPFGSPEYTLFRRTPIEYGRPSAELVKRKREREEVTGFSAHWSMEEEFAKVKGNWVIPG